jgi:hypothetical protein
MDFTPDIENWIEQTSKELINGYGLYKPFAYNISVLYLYLYNYGISPVVNSGYRSESDQKKLLQRYYAGDPSIKYKPAENSQHSTTEEGFFGKKPAATAIDISTSNPSLAADIAEQLNIGAGWRFGDPVHFYYKAI